MWHLDKIPKVVHLYWGNDTISFLRYLTVLSFRKFNPNWKIKVYYPHKKYVGDRTWNSREHNIVFSGPNYYDQLMDIDIEHIEIDFSELGLNNDIPETFKSDFLRWYILSTEGGLWSDFDIIYIKTMDDLYLNRNFNNQIDTMLCINEDREYHSIGFLLASAGNELFRLIHEQSYYCLNLKHYQSIGSKLLKYHIPNMGSINSKFKTIHAVNLKMEVVYPSPINRITAIFNSNHQQIITDDTLGIHWFAGHPLAGKFEKLLTEDNYHHYPIFIADIIARVM